jgi:fluoride exporter
MEFLKSSLAVAVGAALGANARYWFSAWFVVRFGSKFPLHTLLINVVGSLILGIFMAVALTRGWGTGPRLIVAVGFAGGFTTFSTFSAEIIRLIEDHRYGLAAVYALASNGLSVGACLLGAHLARLALLRSST